MACKIALQACRVEVSIVAESLRYLQSGNKPTTDQVSGLDTLTARLDEKYFDLQDSLDEGRSLNGEGLQLFSQARAVSVLSLAGGEDSLMAATAAIYDASSAVDDGTNIFKAVLSVQKIPLNSSIASRLLIKKLVRSSKAQLILAQPWIG